MTSTLYEDYEDNFVPSDPSLAPEQEMFAKYPGPYSILSAGAGAGKTYTIQAKIDWLTKVANIDLKNILALSFTRTAAGNLTKRYPGLKSMTFDSFSANIFEEMFPNGKNLIISDDMSVKSAMNSVYEHNGYATLKQDEVESIIHAVRKATPTNKFQKVDINISIGELTLAVIRYQDTFKKMLIKAGVVSFNIRKAFTTANSLQKLPKAYQNVEYLIIDEAQDSTQPETVMVLTLAVANKWRVAMVGDASQNISEWRGVSPEAFIESQHLSGFKNFTLQSNYRSEFPILHVANQMLQYAETNETAQIQLNTPKASMPMIDEFKNRIHMYQLAGDPIDYKDAKNAQGKSLFSNSYGPLPNSIGGKFDIDKMIEIIQTAKSKNESLAILCRSNLMVNAISEELAVHNVDMFTKPATKQGSSYMSETSQALINSASSINQLLSVLTNKVVIETAMKKVMYKVYPSQVTKLATNLKKAMTTPGSNAAIQAQDLNRTKLSIQYGIIRLEAIENAQRQQLDANDVTNQLADQDYVVATYHSSKGLEWDNVIVIDENRMSASNNRRNAQEELRLSYVAVTRARKQLHIVQLINYKYNDPNVIVNNKTSVIANPFGSAYVLALSRTYTQNGDKADILAEIPNATLVEKSQALEDDD